MRSFARAAAQAERARQRARDQADAAARRALRDAERQAKADAKEAARDYLAAQIEEAETLSREVREQEQAIGTLLVRALAVSPAIDLQQRIKTFVPARFNMTTRTREVAHRHHAKMGSQRAIEASCRARRDGQILCNVGVIECIQSS